MTAVFVGGAGLPMATVMEIDPSAVVTYFKVSLKVLYRVERVKTNKIDHVRPIYTLVHYGYCRPTFHRLLLHSDIRCRE